MHPLPPSFPSLSLLQTRTLRRLARQCWGSGSAPAGGSLWCVQRARQVQNTAHYLAAKLPMASRRQGRAGRWAAAATVGLLVAAAGPRPGAARLLSEPGPPGPGAEVLLHAYVVGHRGDGYPRLSHAADPPPIPPGPLPRPAATGTYQAAETTASNFARLAIETTSVGGTYNDTYQMYSAGWVEGMMTSGTITDHVMNIKSWVAGRTGGNSTETYKGVVAFLRAQDAWVQAMKISSTADGIAAGLSDEEATVRRGLALLDAQLSGLVEGHNAAVAIGKPGGYLGRDDFLLLNALGDLIDIIPALSADGKEGRTDWAAMSPDEMVHEIASQGHCSGFVKVRIPPPAAAPPWG